jgi:argininosuccinate lyase
MADFRAALPDLDESVYDALGVERALHAFTSYGSAGPDQVRAQVAAWKQRLAL